MCNQAVGLIAAELERRGITTVCIVLLREVAENVRPPRALYVPFRHGYPLGVPNDATIQRAVIEAALRIAERDGEPPILETFTTNV
jgi:D-proline reductase (dithiol) PrdB